MLGPETYKRWTAPFCDGSYYTGSWEQGSQIRFLTPAGEGMVKIGGLAGLHQHVNELFRCDNPSDAQSRREDLRECADVNERSGYGAVEFKQRGQSGALVAQIAVCVVFQ